MKYLIYYVEDSEVRSLSDINSLRSEVTLGAAQQYIQNRWSAFIPMLPTSGEGATREEARADAIKNAYIAIADYVELGSLHAEQLRELHFEDSEEQLTLQELSRLGPRFDTDTTE